MLRQIVRVLKPLNQQLYRKYTFTASMLTLRDQHQEVIKQTCNTITNSFLMHHLSKSKKLISPVLENFVSINNKPLLTEMISNPGEWSLFFSNETDLKIFIHLMLIEAIATEQLKQNEPEFYLQLADSLTNYLLSINPNEESIQFGYMKVLISIYCTYLENEILVHKKPPNSIEDAKFKQRLNQLDYYLRLLMKRYKNFDEISILDKDIFIRGFSFFETKWSYLTKTLLDQPLEINALYTQQNLSNVLRGAIRFNRIDVFHKICVKLNEWNLTGSITSSFQPNQAVFKEYFSLKGDNMSQDLYDLFESWRICYYVPCRQVIDLLKKFIQK